jgi:7,8-dihydroneopterin aldolase/epimerase/oxygenase
MSLSNNIKSHLLLRDIELCIFLGWPESERLEAQIVLLDLDIEFSQPPKACLSDDLVDTFCYADLITKIHTELGAKNYRLIEHLTYEIYTLVKRDLPPDASLLVRLTKHPKIQSLSGGVCFSYGDEK